MVRASCRFAAPDDGRQYNPINKYMKPLTPIIKAKTPDGQEYFIDARGHAYLADCTRIPEYDTVPSHNGSIAVDRIARAILETNNTFKDHTISMALAVITSRLGILPELRIESDKMDKERLKNENERISQN